MSDAEVAHLNTGLLEFRHKLSKESLVESHQMVDLDSATSPVIRGE
jgi:hypothetical protein